MAFRACAISAIEGKASRLQLGDVEPAVRASHRGGIELLLSPGNCGKDQAVRHLQRFGNGRFQSFFYTRFQHDAVDDGFNRVLLVPFELNGVGEVTHFAVDAGAKALLVQVVQQVFELAFAAANDRRVNNDAFSRCKRKDALHDLLGGLPRNRFAAIRTVGHTDRRVEQAQVVIDFCNGADGGSRAAAGGLLFDGDCGAEPFNGIDIRALDLVKELAGVCRKSFDIAPLTFGVDGVKGKRRFTGSRKTGYHGKRIARNANVDVAQIVLARTAHGDMSDGH